MKRPSPETGEPNAAGVAADDVLGPPPILSGYEGSLALRRLEQKVQWYCKVDRHGRVGSAWIVSSTCLHQAGSIVDS